ncbi:MAG: DNA polymerase IV [Acidobacteria bacterium RIFCSPLOWO2_12_FULL_54_10]|nr:MAG: DNA polymerase IV [Acidobacteria bacterium RIFCSPLOWO2_12_FULL_54_10]
MQDAPLSIHGFPRAIVHIDGDAFFASCEQARDPALQGKPVITGKERGIVASMSYEAKRRGVTRAMRLFEVRKICPDAILLPSDYETYSLLSKRFFTIVRRYTPDVEEYGIDECFADLTGLRRLLRMSYIDMAEKIKHELDTALGFTFSVGLGPNKVIAKIASKWKKPSGLTAIMARDIHLYLKELPIEKVWGIGPQTTAYLQKQGIQTALDFAHKDEAWVRQHLTKPHLEIWQELNGNSVLQLSTEEKTSYASIQKVKTFTPPSEDKEFVFSQLSKNIENATIKARRYRLAPSAFVVYLRTQDFRSAGMEVRLSHRTSIPNDLIASSRPAFDRIFRPGTFYRSTGVVLLDLENDETPQLNLFASPSKIIAMRELYEGVDEVRRKYGKHTLYLGSSFLANQFAQHLGERGDIPRRKETLLKGETGRKRLGIPMFLADIE